MDLRTASDETLLAALSDDVGALDLLYERHAPAAMGLAMRMLPDREAAEDVVQEAFVALWRHARSYAPARGSVRTWLLGIVHHRAIDRLRGRRPTEALPEEVRADPAETDVWSQAAQRLDREEIRRALAALPAEQREAIELAYFSGFTQAQIASALGVPLGTVKGRLRLGLARLRALLPRPTESER
jgi:RNA polymerase sigma-70 factor (ECF subfamily)